MTNEPPESLAQVMDGPGRRAEGRAWDGGERPTKINVSFSWSQARQGEELGIWGDASMKSLGSGVGEQGTETEKQKPRDKGRGQREREVGTQRLRQRSPEMEWGVGERD